MSNLFDRMCGELHAEHDTEEQFFCQGCSKPKLYRNKTTGRFICFVCGYAGTDTMDGGPVYLRSRPTEETRRWVLRKNPPDYALLATRGLNREQVDYLGFLGRGIPLYLGSQPCGIQYYDPTGSPKYWTQGDRGVAWAGLDQPSPKSIYLFEGMFDWASVAANHQGHRRTFAFLAGNQINPSQANELFVNSTTDTTIHICFDNDKPAAAARAALLLGSIRKVRFKFPPTQYKDWDEAIQAGKNEEF